MLAISVVDGSTIWNRAVLRDVTGLVIDSQGTIYIGTYLSESATIYKLSGETGTLITRQPLRIPSLNKLVLSQRGLFVGMSRNMLFVNDQRPPSYVPPPRTASAAPKSSATPGGGSPNPRPLPPNARRLPQTPSSSSGIQNNSPLSTDGQSEGMSPGIVFAIAFAVAAVVAIAVGIFWMRNLNAAGAAYSYSQFR